MNSAEQQTHRTKTAALEARIAVLETVVDDLAAYLAKWAPTLAATLEQHAGEFEAVHLHIEKRRSDILQEVGAAIGELRARNLSQRLRWLVTGR